MIEFAAVARDRWRRALAGGKHTFRSLQPIAAGKHRPDPLQRAGPRLKTGASFRSKTRGLRWRMASNSSPIKKSFHFRYFFGVGEVQVLSRELHVRDLAARLLAQKLEATARELAKYTGITPEIHSRFTGKYGKAMDSLYHAALLEAEEQLHADF